MVLRGAAGVLASDRPYVVSEIHPEQLRVVSGTSPAALFADLARAGYRPHRVEAGGVGQPLDAGAVTGVTTVVLVPQ